MIKTDKTMQTPIQKLSKRLDIIVEAARKHKRVRIKYKKQTGKIVFRNIAAYSYRDGLLFVTDTQHGNKKIRGLRITNIISAKMLDDKFKPEWEIKL